MAIKEAILHFFRGSIIPSVKCKKRSWILHPSVIRRNKGSIILGERVHIYRYSRLLCINNQSIIKIGNNNDIGYRFSVLCKSSVVIGNNNFIVSDVFITDYNHSIDKTKHFNELESKSVTIGSNIWIGEKVVILPGVSIGDGAVIGAGSVVTKSIQSNCLAVGNPAHVIKKWDSSIRKWVTFKK